MNRWLQLELDFCLRYTCRKKPAKYGIRVFDLVSTNIFYSLNLGIYVGFQPNGPFHVSTSTKYTVKRLVEPAPGSNRSTTADNLFISIHFLAVKSLTYIGTVGNKKQT